MMNKHLNGDDNENDDGFGNSIFFGIDVGLSLTGSDQEQYTGLGGNFDQSISSNLDVLNDRNQPLLSRDSIPMNRTSSSCTAFAVPSNEEKENDYCDTIRDDILYVRHKASILQRASHILLQQQRDYHKVASYYACIDEARRAPTTNTISIWDEAKLFLQTENDSLEEINPPQVATSFVTTNQESIPTGGRPDFQDVTNSMKSLNAVHQYCISNRSDQPRFDAPPTTTSPKVRPFVGTTNDVPNSHVPKYLIDTSVVQYVSSVQYDTFAAVVRPLSEQINRALHAEKANACTGSTIDNWYNHMTGDVCPQRPTDKKRKRHLIAACKHSYLPSKTTRTVDRLNHGKNRRGSFCHSHNDSTSNQTLKAKSALLPYHRILSPFNKPCQDEWKELILR